MNFTQEQYIRYSRQLMLPELLGLGQRKLFEARVLLVGLGGLGSPQALYLAAAGVGTLGLADGDRVDLSNLHRQVIHATPDLGRPKVDSARDRIRALNPEVKVCIHAERLSSGNALEILSGYDLIVDCTDNFPVRYLLNDACVLLGKPLVHGAVYRFEGQSTVFHPAAGGPCYRCLFPVPPSPGLVPTCAEAGVIGMIPGLVGLVQATEVVKLILGKGRSLVGRLLFVDLLAAQFQELEIRRDPKCAVCGDHPTIRELVDYEVFCGLRREERAEAGTGGEPVRGISVIDLERRLQAGEPLLFLDVREEWERSLFSSPEGYRIPFSRLASEWSVLQPCRDRELVVCCLFGWKSREAARFLAGKGFPRVLNLEGGLDAWVLYQEQQTTGRP